MMDKPKSQKHLKQPQKKSSRQTSTFVIKMTESHFVSVALEIIMHDKTGRDSGRAGSNSHHGQDETCHMATCRGGGELLPC